MNNKNKNLQQLRKPLIEHHDKETISVSTPIPKVSEEDRLPVLSADLALDFQRLQLIKSQTYSVTHPFQQSRGPPLLIFPPNITEREQKLRQSSPPKVQQIDRLTHKYSLDYNMTVASGKCGICIEHKYVAAYLWKWYLRRHYLQGHSSRFFREGGFYFEMGGLDGLSGSTTLFLDEVLHWKGILIEANPPNFASLIANRPSAYKVEMAACSCPSGRTQTPCQLEFIGDYGGTGGAIGSMDKNVRTVFHGERQDTYNVSCLPLSDIFERANIKEIDFFSLDVEGAEYSSFLTIDFQKVKIWLILVEQNEFVETTKLVRQFLLEKGFQFRLKLGEMNELWENPNYFSSKINNRR